MYDYRASLLQILYELRLILRLMLMFRGCDGFDVRDAGPGAAAAAAGTCCRVG